MKDRIKKLRKELNLTQQKVADILGLKQNTIASYEIGRIIPSDAAITHICKTWDVNEEWLRTGEGEMFIDIPEEDLYAKAAASLLKENDILGIEGLKLYYSLPAESKAAVKEYVLRLAEAIKEKEFD